MKSLIILLSIFVSSLAIAGDITITNGKIKSLPPGAKVTAAYLKINNTSNKDQTLKELKGSFAEYFEIHDMKKENGTMKMIKINELKIPANSSVSLELGGKHIMVFDIINPIKKNETYKIDLIFENNLKITAELIAEGF